MRIDIVVPYFGAFNTYFSQWIKTCGRNTSVNWIVFTDQNVDCLGNTYKNIRFVPTTFLQLRERIQRKFQFSISLDRPYKLCDYKPLYGYLFSEYLHEADFWGFCDMDVLFGDILQFLPSSVWTGYDRIFCKGHLCFVRNTKEINENFLSFDTYKTVFSSPAIYGYDEAFYGFHMGFSGELITNGFKVYSDDSSIADIDFRKKPFQIVGKPGVFYVFAIVNGRLYKMWRDKEKSIRKEEISYIHLQKRKMILETDNQDLLIVPNRIMDYNELKLNKDTFWDEAFQEDEDYYSTRKEKKAILINDIKKAIHEKHLASAILWRIKGGSYGNDEECDL